MSALYRFVRPVLFRLPPETAHALSLALLRLGGSAPGRPLLRVLFPPVDDPLEIFGLRFPNRVGLAAGYDKDAEAVAGLAALGFGHLELGTVTPEPQAGNPRPRVFRLVEDACVVNRMGFPSQGAARVARRLARPRAGRAVLGLNLGKQRSTPIEDAADDYLRLMDAFAPLAGYLAINVSSPNTPGLRDLQGRAQLERLVRVLVPRRDALAAGLGRPLPLLVKLSPDMADADLDDAVDVLVGEGIDGVIATNTTRSRDGARSPRAAEEGGLSGALVAARSDRAIARMAARARGRLPIVGVGGILSGADARRKLEAGASLVQLYTGMIFRGPGLVREVAAAVAAASRRE